MSAPASLLVELHTEELPPKALKALSEAFAAAIAQGLRARQFLKVESVVTPFGAPRRLAVHITHVLNRSPDKPFKQKLMPLSVAGTAPSWTQAFLKKLESMGRRHMADVPVGTYDGADCLVIERDGKTDSLFLQSVASGQTLIVALQSALEEAIESLPVPKMMSYQLADGETTTKFVRPAHHLIAMHGHAVVPVHALGLQAGTKTQGHRFLAPGTLTVLSADMYAEQLLEDGYVIASFYERRAKIESLLLAEATKHDAQPVVPADLLDEVTSLVEWPVVYDSTFDAEYLSVPTECLLLTMQQNQKYFALNDRAGRLTNRFLLVSNIQATDGGVAIRAGNARVVRARLADAKFFYDQDRKQTLESRVPGLAHVVYHGKLGSQLQRVERIILIAVGIAKELGVDPTVTERAARLAKADLRTLMVGEFPELQGVMGEYYALHDGESAEVATAVRQHYRPRFADDALPESIIGVCVALADKLETMVGLFGVGEQPTGDKDPFGLRRQAIGILRMLMEKHLPLSLHWLSRIAFSAFPPGLIGEAHTDVEWFLLERLRGLLREQGYTANEVESVIVRGPARIDLIPEQLAAVRAFMKLPEAESLASANKRIDNILKKADAVPSSFENALLLEPAERSLGDAFNAVQLWAEQLYASGDYSAMLESLVPLKLPVDRFFDEVMVNVDDPKLRANRLGLLAALRTTMNRVADISKLST